MTRGRQGRKHKEGADQQIGGGTMNDNADLAGTIYRTQLRSWAALAQFALRRVAECHEAGVEAVRQTLTANLKQCDALLEGDAANAWKTAPGYAASSGAEMAARWQRTWLGMATHAQMDAARLGNQLAAEWAAMTAGAVATPPANKAAPVAFPSFNPAYDMMMQSWAAALGAATRGKG
jgi:hypothetical protein